MTDRQAAPDSGALPQTARAAGGVHDLSAAATGRTRVFKRFNIHQRIQHFMLAFSFLGLMITGMPLRFPELLVTQLFIAALGGVEVVGIIHRVLGVVMALSGAYHVVYLAAMFRKGYRRTPVLFKLEDLKLFIDDMKYFLGLRKELPDFGRYNWREKFDYFGACFGVALMVATGVVIWFPQIVTLVFPGWIVTASVLVHEYEALLAGLAIFLSHFYWVHLNREVYPMSMVWLTGEMSAEEMKLRHPREYREIIERERRESTLGSPETAHVVDAAATDRVPAGEEEETA